MPERKGITVKIPADFHTEVKAYPFSWLSQLLLGFKPRKICKQFGGKNAYEAAKNIEDGIAETLTYCDFLNEH